LNKSTFKMSHNFNKMMLISILKCKITFLKIKKENKHLKISTLHQILKTLGFKSKIFLNIIYKMIAMISKIHSNS
jgi:hypothetical protein